jgi:hypothetical protein
MLVVGAGNTGVQVASIFNAFGSRVQLFEALPRILPTEDDDFAAAVAAGFRDSGMVVRENFGAIESFEKTPTGVRMNFSKDGKRDCTEATLDVVAVGWVADPAALNLPAAGVEIDRRKFVRVDGYLRTSAPHVFAAGDVTGRLMLVPEAIQDGFVAATNAVRGLTMPLADHLSPAGSFTDPEYAQVGLTEKKARETHDVVTEVVRFDSTTRTIIDGRKFGFCKLIADRKTGRIIGCHVVGDRAVEDRHRRGDAGRRVGSRSALVPDLRRDPGSRGGQRGNPAQPSGELASTPGRLSSTDARCMAGWAAVEGNESALGHRAFTVIALDSSEACPEFNERVRRGHSPSRSSGSGAPTSMKPEDESFRTHCPAPSVVARVGPTTPPQPGRARRRQGASPSWFMSASQGPN